MPQDYNQTLNLPKTDFPMRGNLPKREPETLAHWEEENLYQKMVARNEGKPKYVLHDGPPMPTARSIWARRSTRCSRILSLSTRI